MAYKNQGNFILLNKPFNGSWTDMAGNIAHEIIDFFLSDNDKYYVYNMPYGAAAKGRIPEYIFLTSGLRDKKIYLEYIIKPIRQLHSFGYDKRSIGTVKNQKNRDWIIKNVIKKEDIKYGGKLLSDIYKQNADVGLLVTYEAEWIKAAKVPVAINFNGNYIFQRNMGVVQESEQPNLYNDLIHKANDMSLWMPYTLTKIGIPKLVCGGSGSMEFGRASTAKINGLPFTQATFLDFIMKTDSEECYTNILYNLFASNTVLLTRFLDAISKGAIKAGGVPIEIRREKKIVQGRMDICAEFSVGGVVHRVVLENKVDSGLNGKKPKEKTTQLDEYYRWAIENGATPHCFILVPNYHLDDLEYDIKKYASGMASCYTITTYKEIFDFFKAEKKTISASKPYGRFYDDVLELFGRLSLSRRNLFEYLFIQAILNA